MRSPDEFEKINPERFLEGVTQAPYPKFLGLKYEEVRKGYARMRLPYRPELNQPAGIFMAVQLLA
jgi:acyl-coenzyme A thioesterase PaaI-like protein